MQRAEVLLEDLTDRDLIDIVVLSEMVFTGYKFKDKEEISPYLEKAGEGPTLHGALI
jgi:predicted amidohydrolase